MHYFLANQSIRWFFIVFLLCHISVSAQSGDLQTLFDQGMILYRNQHYDQAKVTFQKLVDSPAPNPFITMGHFLLARTALHSGDMNRAMESAEVLIHFYPASRYTAFAHFSLAQVYQRRGDDLSALKHLGFAIEKTESNAFVSLCDELARELLQSGVDTNSLEDLLTVFPWNRARGHVALWLAEALYARGHQTQAENLLNDYITANADAALKKEADDLSEQTAPVRLGIVLPLTGYFADEAKDLLRGMAFALKQDETESIELYVRDSRGSAVGAIRATVELMQNDMNLIIGGLEGHTASAIAGLTAQNGVPLIVPVATDNGIASMGPQIFQANNDLETRGRALAEYAFENLHMRTFATLAPADEYGHALTDAFSSKVDQLGGIIIAQQWYYSGANDLKNQFDAIRESGFRYSLRDSLIQMGISLKTQRIDSLYKSIDRNLRITSDDNEGLLEQTDIPVTSIDGFFFPIYEEDLSTVAPQFALSNIRSRPLGGNYWLNLEILIKQKRYVNGAVFVAGSYIDENDALYQSFENKFRMATSTSPGVMAVYGYNIMNLLKKTIAAGNRSRGDIVEYLKNVELFEGLGGDISFKNNERVNGAVHILQFQDDRVLKVN